MSNTLKDRLMQWWTPEGWETHQPPESWAIANDKGGSIDWRDAKKAAGYDRLCRFGNTTDYETTADVDIWTQHDQHLLVEMCSDDSLLAEFFVSPQHRVAFLVDRLPLLLSTLSAHLTYPSLAEEVRKLRKAVVAFVRHGKGEYVIDDDGETSIDDRRRWEQERRQSEQWAAKARASAEAKQ